MLLLKYRMVTAFVDSSHFGSFVMHFTHRKRTSWRICVKKVAERSRCIINIGDTAIVAFELSWMGDTFTKRSSNTMDGKLTIWTRCIVVTAFCLKISNYGESSYIDKDNLNEPVFFFICSKICLFACNAALFSSPLTIFLSLTISLYLSDIRCFWRSCSRYAFSR